MSWHRPETRNGISVLEINSKDERTKFNQSYSDIKLYTAFTIFTESVIARGFNAQLIILLPQCPCNNLADHTYRYQINATPTNEIIGEWCAYIMTFTSIPGICLCMGAANGTRLYNVTSLDGWAHTQQFSCNVCLLTSSVLRDGLNYFLVSYFNHL